MYIIVHDCLLDHWQSNNTRAIGSNANLPKTSINLAVVNIFFCWSLRGEFDNRLDFAVRDWARRPGTVRRELDISDTARLDALSGMFERFHYSPFEAAVRARIVYFIQIDYYALDIRESLQERMQRGEDYLFCMTGEKSTKDELMALASFSV